MSPPRRSLGFLNDQADAPRRAGRIRDRLRLGCPDGGQLALLQGDDHDRQPESGAQPISHTECSSPADPGSPGHVPQRRHRGTDALDGRRVDGGAAAL